LFKQMIKIYGSGFSEDDLMQFRKVLNNNVITSIQTLVNQSDTLTAAGELGCTVSAALQASKEYIAELKVDEDTTLTKETADHTKKLWKDPGIQKCYELRSKFQLPDSTAYLMDRLDDMCSPTYVPSFDDAMRARSRTTGIVHTDFEIEKQKFTMYDVGGQRNERRKWVHCFDNVTAILFVVAISEYDQVCFEDEKTNRIDEALRIFDEVVNNKVFEETSMLLFLNKRDLFQKKIKKVPLTAYDPDYTGADGDEKAGYEYFQNRFVAVVKPPVEGSNKAPKNIYFHVTCATDSDNVKFVFNSVKDTVVQANLRQGGLLPMI